MDGHNARLLNSEHACQTRHPTGGLKTGMFRPEALDAALCTPGRTYTNSSLRPATKLGRIRCSFPAPASPPILSPAMITDTVGFTLKTP